ncbi:hypothetical protein GCM10009111_22270 [Colwellia asteriadis]|uniref:diguanylate cyclase n=1 Tax=Colwellia asteriadis TaxID=517723 RepID=A0ABP3WHB0_9GAMM
MSNIEHTILVVDDAKDTQLILEFDLAAAGYQVIACDNGQAAIDMLESEEVDLVLLDMYMPGLSGLETLEKIKQQDKYLNLSIIMLSASNDEDEVVAALELGAADYVVKPYVTKILLARIRTAIKLKEKTEQLEYLAKTDFLTGIHNRGSFFELSTNALSATDRATQPLVIVMLDIDHFKRVNDNYGHDVGDKVLVSFVECLTKHFRDYDILGRIGGEEFAVCLTNITTEKAHLVCERLRKAVEKLTIIADDITINITVSIGITAAQGKILSIDALLKQADDALYSAKENGRNQVIDFTELDEKVINKLNSDEVEANINASHTIELAQHHLGSHEEGEIMSQESITIDGVDSQVGLSNVLEDEALFKEILVMFYQDHVDDVNKLQSAIDNQDKNTQKLLAHTLKGVSSSVGAMVLFEKAKALDSAIDNNNNDDILATLLHELSLEFTKVMTSIKKSLVLEG